MKRSVLLTLAFLTALIPSCDRFRQKGALAERSTTATLRAGDQAPLFVLQQVDKGEVDLSAVLTSNKIVLLNFWSIDCPVCWIEMLELEKAHQQFGAEGVQILAVSPNSLEELGTYLELESISFVLLADAGGQVAQRYGIEVLPTSLLVDRSGKITSINTGIFFQLKSRLAVLLETKTSGE
jgi:peroxiredoxin